MLHCIDGLLLVGCTDDLDGRTFHGSNNNGIAFSDDTEYYFERIVDILLVLVAYSESAADIHFEIVDTHSEPYCFAYFDFLVASDLVHNTNLLVVVDTSVQEVDMALVLGQVERILLLEVELHKVDINHLLHRCINNHRQIRIMH